MIDVRVTDKLVDNTSRGRLRALYEWLTGAASSDPPPEAASDRASAPTRELRPARIGHYAIAHKLGEGGMGVVYAARDERLDRPVALKTMSSPVGDETARKRFWREARAAASVNHPNVCQIYEIGEDRGDLFIAMELLQGEVLTERLRRGAMSVSDALPIALDMLAALSALHARGIVHRDLKPSNVFLTAHGLKLLDFGLARPEIADSNGELADLTRTGVVMGTPRYMAPEQVTGGTADARSDLFAAGAILFEMLAGRPAFAGRTIVEVLHATRYEQPPALTGSPAVAAVDRVIRRALAKRADERPSSADVMAGELRTVAGLEGDDTPTLAHAMTRLVVLPFRVLRPDPETDFLAFSLPDAIATSLSGIGSLVLRSSAVAARFAGETLDLKALAAEADVDRVVMGTL
jgi:serine/threonine protein kinase